MKFGMKFKIPNKQCPSEIKKPEPALTRDNSTVSKCRSELEMEQRIVNDKLKFLGDARFATLVVSCLTLLGILISLAAPVLKEAKQFWIAFKCYYLFACLIIIMGIIAILQYNRVMINWYFAFYTLLGMISMSLSSLQLYAISIKIQKSPPDCNPLISNQCVSFRDYFFISLQALQIVFWIVGWSLFYRFMQRFYMKQRIWKEKYANSTGQDADFTHWLYKNCIEDY